VTGRTPPIRFLTSCSPRRRSTPRNKRRSKQRKDPETSGIVGHLSIWGTATIPVCAEPRATMPTSDNSGRLDSNQRPPGPKPGALIQTELRPARRRAVGQANQREDATVRVPDDRSPDRRRTTTSTRGSPTPNDTAIGHGKVYRAAAVRDNRERPMKPRQSGVPVIKLAARNRKYRMRLPPRR
jgi:hypothetical protein